MDKKPRTGGDGASHSRFPEGFRILQGRREYVTYPERSSVRIWYSDAPCHYESHFHSAVEIVMALRGEVVYNLLDGTYRLQAGEALIVPSNCSHEMSMQEGSARQIILFEPSGVFAMRDMPSIDELLQQPLCLRAGSALTAAVREQLVRAVEVYERREPMWNSLCYACFLQMYALLGQDFLRRSEVSEPARHQIDTEIMDSARLYIDQNYMLDIDLGDVAAFCGFSKYYFSRVFKHQMGYSFSEYLRQKRVSVAEDRLIHSAQPIQEIAATSGFGSIATFNRVFKEAKNCTPSRYREIYSDYP